MTLDNIPRFSSYDVPPTRENIERRAALYRASIEQKEKDLERTKELLQACYRLLEMMEESEDE